MSSGVFVRLASTCSFVTRGGDRRLNRALHTIAVQRSRTDTQTIAYITRRQSEGKSLREALRCLKRYLARSLFRTLEATSATA